MNSNLPNASNSPQSQRAQAFNYVGSRTQIAANVSKLREGNAIHHRQDSRSHLTTATAQADMLQISQEQQVRIIDNENALALMPEIEWASRVLVSSILSPKDMTKRELLYNIDIDWLPPSVSATIVEEIKNEIDRVYDYANSLYPVIKDCLFTKGSHPRLVLPEAAVDRVINSGETLTMESISGMFDKKSGHLKRKGFFGEFSKAGVGQKTSINMESFVRANSYKGDSSPDEQFLVPTGVDGDKKTIYEALPGITLTDNVDAIKLPFYLEAVASATRESLMGFPEVDFGDFQFTESTNESKPGFTKTQIKSPNAQLTPSEFRAATYKSAPNNMVTHLRIPGQEELKRRSVGRPLVASVPPEAVIPINVPGDVRRKLGYIILIDDDGHYVSLHNSSQLIGRAAQQYNAMNSTDSMGKDNSASAIIGKAARNMTGGTKATTFRDASKIFEQLVEDNIIPRLMNGAYPGGGEIGDSGDLYTLMLARTLCSMRTRLVFVPADMMSYFAFDYHANGMGKSLLDTNKILISIRAGLLLTRMTGEIRNSIPLTKVTMKIDEEDYDWEKTWSETQDIISKTRQPHYPLNTLAINDLMDWIHQAGFVFAFEGHPGIPDTGFTFDKINHENPLPDQDFYDSLGKTLYMGFGIPPELMDSTYDPEFAIAVATRNIMFTQTILEYQKITSGLITDDHHRLILSDGNIMNSVAGMVKSKWGEIATSLPEEDRLLLKDNPQRYALDLVKKIVTSIKVTLPSPDATTMENQSEQLQQFKSLLDDLLPAFASEDVISSDLAPEISQKIATMQNMIKAAMTRQFCSEKNIMPELFQISSMDDEGKPAFDLLKITESYTKGVIANIMPFAKSLISTDTAVKKDSETLNLGNEGSGGGFSSSGSDSSNFDGGGDFGEDMGGGLDDMNLEMPSFNEGGSDESDSTPENPPEENA